MVVNLNPVSFSVNYFWGRRPDGVAINEALQYYILYAHRLPSSPILGLDPGKSPLDVIDVY